MHKMIAESGGWQTADDTMKRERGQLSRNKQFIDVKIGNLLNLLADGRAQASLLGKIDTLEAEKAEVQRETDRLDLEIEGSTIARPTAKMVQQAWSKLPDLWDDATEEERTELRQSIVREVVVVEKNSVVLRLSPIAENSEFKVRDYSKNGSGGVS